MRTNLCCFVANALRTPGTIQKTCSPRASTELLLHPVSQLVILDYTEDQDHSGRSELMLAGCAYDEDAISSRRRQDRAGKHDSVAPGAFVSVVQHWETASLAVYVVCRLGLR